MLLVVHARLFPNATVETLRAESSAVRVWEASPGVVHLEYASIPDFAADPVARRIAAVQGSVIAAERRRGLY